MRESSFISMKLTNSSKKSRVLLRSPSKLSGGCPSSRGPFPDVSSSRLARVYGSSPVPLGGRPPPFRRPHLVDENGSRVSGSSSLSSSWSSSSAPGNKGAKDGLKVAVGALVVGGFHTNVITGISTGMGGANTLVGSVPMGSPVCSIRSMLIPSTAQFSSPKESRALRIASQPSPRLRISNQTP